MPYYRINGIRYYANIDNRRITIASSQDGPVSHTYTGEALMPSNFFDNEDFENSCTCDDCQAARVIRRLRTENATWAAQQFIQYPSIRACVMARLTGYHSTHLMEAGPSSRQVIPNGYYLFLVPGTVVNDVPLRSITRHTSGMYFALTSYQSDLEVNGMLQRHTDGYFYLEVPPPTPCDVCGSIATNVLTMGKYKVHPQCVQSDGYGHGNNKRVAMQSPTALPTFSVEFEMYANSRNDAGYADVIVELIKHGQFKRTSDGTVSDEMVSPIYHSDRLFLATLSIMDKGRTFVTERCGTHIHTGMTEYPADFYRNRHSDIFGQLQGHMQRSTVKTPTIWGRDFSQWALPNYQGGRYCWLNFETGYDTVEYRLPRFKNSYQYLMLTRFARLFTYQLRKVYNEHYRQSPSKERWSNQEGARYFLDFYKKFEEYAFPRIVMHNH